MLGHSVQEAAKQLGCSTQKIFAGIKHGKVRAEKFGNSFVIDDEELERLKRTPFQLSRKQYRNWSVRRK
ncbi:excisionase family DNA-binding protein [Thermodesulfobacteriota bacterium]